MSVRLQRQPLHRYCHDNCKLDPAAHGMGAPQGWQGVAMTAIQTIWTQLAPGLARQNTCLSPQCSTDLTMTGVRPPKFLDGNEPTETIPRASLNAGTVAGGTLFQPFPHATPRCRPVDLSTPGHTGILLREIGRFFENAPSGRQECRQRSV